MDAMGVDMQFVMPAPPQIYHTLALDVAVPAARMVNDSMAEFCAKHKDRLIPCGTVPMQDGNEAAKELEYVVKTLGFKGVEILTNVDGRELSDPAFAPFWKKAEELDALVAIHPNGFTEGRRLSRFYFSNVVGNPFETALALHYLIFDGVFERHPKLKVFAMHGGGYLGGYSGRIDHAWGARSDVHADVPNPPTSYLRKNVFFDTVVFTPLQLEMLVRTFGVDRVLLGTDYPFDMLEYDPVGHVAGVEALDDSARAAIDGLNAKKLLGV
jgi:aminocarboxymuconate-semialdehyde decarboxylase